MIAVEPKICFELCSGGGDGDVVCVAPGQLTIGSDDECDIVLKGDLVAPERATFDVSAGAEGLAISSRDVSFEYEGNTSHAYEDLPLPAVIRVSVTEMWVSTTERSDPASAEDASSESSGGGADSAQSQGDSSAAGIVCDGCGRVNDPGATWCDRCGRDLT